MGFSILPNIKKNMSKEQNVPPFEIENKESFNKLFKKHPDAIFQ